MLAIRASVSTNRHKWLSTGRSTVGNLFSIIFFFLSDILQRYAHIL